MLIRPSVTGERTTTLWSFHTQRMMRACVSKCVGHFVDTLSSDLQVLESSSFLRGYSEMLHLFYQSVLASASKLV